MSEPVCYYRDAKAPSFAALDYFLWPESKFCGGKKANSSCAPPSPSFPATADEIETYENRAVKPDFKRLPQDEAELENFLRQAEKDGRIVWVGVKRKEIYEQLQNEINSTPSGSNVHLLFGNTHGADGQKEIFNELLTEGKDGRKIRGVTHVVLELPRFLDGGFNLQYNIDRFLTQGVKPILLTSGNWPDTDIAVETDKEVADTEHTFNLSRRECYNLVMADLENGMPKELKTPSNFYYRLAAREIYATKNVFLRMLSNRRNVVFWNWGASHVEKYRLPSHIKFNDPKARVVSVVLNGGTYIDKQTFDRVLKKMGWLEKTFFMKLEGYREADYIIHVPTAGRKIPKELQRMIRSSVLQEIFNPPPRQKKANLLMPSQWRAVSPLYIESLQRSCSEENL